jgi:hypothetical protein
MAANQECNSLMLSDEEFECADYQDAAQKWDNAKAEEGRLIAQRDALSKNFLAGIAESMDCKVSAGNANASFLKRESVSVNCLKIMANSCKSTLDKFARLSNSH